MCIACDHTRLYRVLSMPCMRNGKRYVGTSFPTVIRQTSFNRLCREIIEDFDNHIELLDVKKPRVGVVGEILVKFLPAANNYLVELLESEGAEAVVPDLLDFLLYCFYNQNFKVEKLGFKKSKAQIANLGIHFLEWLRKPATNAFAASSHFAPPARIQKLGEMASRSYLLEIRPVRDGSRPEKCWSLYTVMLRTSYVRSHLPAFQTTSLEKESSKSFADVIRNLTL